ATARAVPEQPGDGGALHTDRGVVDRADLQHGTDLAGTRGRRVHRPHLAKDPVVRELLGRPDPGSLVSGAFLAPVCQQPLPRLDGDVLHVAVRLADQLLDRSDAYPPRLAGEQLRVAD